jgi:micrococcal nuclease
LVPQGPVKSGSAAARIIDGDTFVRADGQHVRLLGIDTPEHNQPFFAEARKLLGELILDRELRYAYGPERTDRYGRTLAFLYAGSTFVNGELVREGMARAYIFSAELLQTEPGSEICADQRVALAAKTGIWSVTPTHPETRYFGNPRTLRFHRPGCRSIRNSDTLELVRSTSREDLLNQCYSPCRNCNP